MSNIRERLIYFSLIVLVVAGFSCTSQKNVIYFRGQGDSTILTSYTAPESYIHTNDILSILVSSLNAEASAAFNYTNETSISSTSISGATNQTSGYLVSPEGFIEFPLLGKIRAEGLTKSQLKDYITLSLIRNKLLKDPIINIRILNYKVTVLGEVEKPGVITVPSEKISLLEALGMAGDITINAQRDNVLVIREETGKKITKRINLNSKELFTSPYYYLKSNDIVYVEPNRVKVRNSSNAALWASVILSVLSFGIILLDHVN